MPVALKKPESAAVPVSKRREILVQHRVYTLLVSIKQNVECVLKGYHRRVAASGCCETCYEPTVVDETVRAQTVGYVGY